MKFPVGELNRMLLSTSTELTIVDVSLIKATNASADISYVFKQNGKEDTMFRGTYHINITGIKAWRKLTGGNVDCDKVYKLMQDKRIISYRTMDEIHTEYGDSAHENLAMRT